MAKHNKKYIHPLLVAALAVICFGRIFSIHWFFYDDSAWLMSSYTTDSLKGFLDTGFLEMRRPLNGIFLYFFFGLYKSTTHAYLIWGLMVLGAEVLSAIFLYRLAVNLSGKHGLFPFLVASAFIVSPIDSTLPVYTHICYRLGVILSIISFYLTSEAVLKDSKKSALIFSALGFSAASHYVMLEGTIAYEPARFLMIAFLLIQKGETRGAAVKEALIIWLPFLLLCLPLLYYKLHFKPYGLYKDEYKMSLSNFLSPDNYANIILSLLFFNWFWFSYLSQNAGAWTYALGLAALPLLFFLFRRLLRDVPETEEMSAEGRVEKGTGLRTRGSVVMGLALIVAPAAMYLLVGKTISYGEMSRHGIILRFGHAFIVGGILWGLSAVLLGRSRKAGVSAMVSLFLALGIFFHNVNIDLYQSLINYEKKFWKVFMERFPSLPEDAVFYIESNVSRPYYDKMNMFFYYQYEFPINMLYAGSTDPAEFRKALFISKNVITFMLSTGKNKVASRSYWGTRALDLEKATVLLYEGDEILVNREILKRYPEIRQAWWMDKDFPPLSPPPPSWPFRHRIEGF